MPVYLAPISRRGFIKRSLAVSALAAMGGCATREFSTRGDTWALLSDTHIAADPNTIHSDVNMTQNLQRVTQEVQAWPKPVANVLINGDLAFTSGEPADYAAVLGLIEPLRQSGLPVHLAMGNHDHREHFWTAMPDEKSSESALPERQISIVRTPRANWFIMDSLEKTLQTPGNLGEAQRDWLARALDQNSDKPAIITIHHNPNSSAPPEKGATKPIGLDDTEQLLAVLRPRRHVKAYFFGHTHHWDVLTDESGLHLINFPPVAYLFQPGQPNGWIHATTYSESVRLQMRCLDRTHKEHGRVLDLKWRA